MPDASVTALARYRLEKAEERYTAAKSLLKDDLFADSANRSYYAIFHAVRAILALDAVDFKKHSAVISYFQQHYIKTGIFPKDFSDKIRDAFSIRQDYDYEDFFTVSKQDVIEQLDHARLLIDSFKKYVEQVDFTKPEQDRC